ncbi:unnamed protein product [Malus baccata var. baccata]
MPLRFLSLPFRFLSSVECRETPFIALQHLGEEASKPSLDNIWRPSFISPTGPLTVGYLVMKNDMTAAVMARNLVTPKDNGLLSKQSDELAVKDSLAVSVQVVPRSEAPNDQPPIPPPSVVPPTVDAPPTTETSPKQPL